MKKYRNLILKKSFLVEIYFVYLHLTKSSASSRSTKKIELRLDFCLKKVFALANIELVRVYVSNRAEINL